MMRKLKREHNKQGVILIMVVFILAIAMIFIASAMLLTQATRNRIYTKAEQSQARLTVTAASEAFYQALMLQEFPDSTLEKLSLGMAADNPIKLVVEGERIPGMTEAADNCTTLYLYQKVVGTETYIYADFTTTIDKETENVTVIFKAKETTPETSLFTNQIDLNGNFHDEYFTVLGKVPDGMAQPSDNTVVVRGGLNQAYSGLNIYSNFIFTDGDVYLGHDINYYGDMVFLQDAILHLSGHESTQINATGDFYFVGENNENSLANTDTTRSWGSGTIWTFLDRTANDDGTGNYAYNFLANKNVLLISADGAWDAALDDSLVAQNASNSTATATWAANYAAGKATTYKDILTNAQDYAKADYDAESKYPTASEAFALISLPTTHTGSTMDFKNFLTQYSYNTSSACVPEGTYNFAGGSNMGEGGFNFGSSTPYVVILDGSKNYKFYFSGTTTYDLTGVMFVVINKTKGVSQTIVLEDGVSMSIPTTDNWSMASSGFFSVNRGFTNATSAYNYIIAGNLKNEFNNDSYSSYYDGKTKPTMFIYGVGDNSISVGSGGCIEAYVGLFDDNYATSTSKVVFGNSYHYIYGRIQATSVTCSGSAARLVMPYCPDPNAKELEDYVLQTSKYEVYDYRYYYT